MIRCTIFIDCCSKLGTKLKRIAGADCLSSRKIMGDIATTRVGHKPGLQVPCSTSSPAFID
jgi:hypothetical protein